MAHPGVRIGWLALLGLVLFACQSPPPTVTPAAEGTAVGSTVQEIQIGPAQGQTAVPGDSVVPPARIAASLPYADPDGMFGVDLPVGWTESRQSIDPSKSDVKLGTYFQPAERNALLSVTLFDKGQRPESLGMTINNLLEISGVLDQPNFLEINREKVYGREDDAMRVEITYTRSDGVDMHSLVQFQIDGTTLSMVHLGVEQSSWRENEGVMRDILASYRVPATTP